MARRKTTNDHGVDEGDQARRPRLQEQQDDDTDDKDAVGKDGRDKLGEVLGHVADFGVDTLDQLAGRAQLVEAHIQAQDMGGQIAAQGVGGGPAQVLGEVDADGGQRLLGNDNDEEQNRQSDQGGGVLAAGGPVDEAPNDLRREQLEADAAQKQQGQQHHTPAIGLQVVG